VTSLISSGSLCYITHTSITPHIIPAVNNIITMLNTQFCQQTWWCKTQLYMRTHINVWLLKKEAHLMLMH